MRPLIKHKFATMTALAAACSVMLAMPAIAATDTVASVPSAVDSSKRVIRVAQPKANTNTSTDSIANVINNSNSAANTNAIGTNAPNINNAPNVNNAPAVQYQPQNQPTLPNTVVSAPSSPAFQNNAAVNTSSRQLTNIPMPTAQISDISFLPTVMINQDARGSKKLDVSLVDEFITDVSPNARHYPPNFPNRTQGYNARKKIENLVKWIEPYATASDASYEVLIRAAKLNAMGRNLDLGSDYAVRGGTYVDRAIKSDPNSGEANFIYGMMLAEGGGFKEGQKYLDRAVALGYSEAEQSLAQSDLLNDRRSQALDRLRRLQSQYPNNSIINQQIKLVEDGKFYIWDLPAPNVNIKPVK